jgi:hypothetical protein
MLPVRGGVDVDLQGWTVHGDVDDSQVGVVDDPGRAGQHYLHEPVA